MPDLISNSKAYLDLLARLKSQIEKAQVRAAVAVNQGLVLPIKQAGGINFATLRREHLARTQDQL